MASAIARVSTSLSPDRLLCPIGCLFGPLGLQPGVRESPSVILDRREVAREPGPEFGESPRRDAENTRQLRVIWIEGAVDPFVVKQSLIRPLFLEREL